MLTAFATALYCFLTYPEDPVKCLQKAVLSSGDSDSIACIAGAFVGTNCGIEALPSNWVAQIEYQNELELLHYFFTNQS